MRFIIKVALCGRCLGLVLPRATPTDRPYTVEVPGREWPWAFAREARRANEPGKQFATGPEN